MDEKIKNILIKKINESLHHNEDIEELVSCFENVDFNSFHTGILIGRLYNSFFYQHRRVLKRSPSDEEFKEFIDFIKNNFKLFAK